MIVHRGWWVIGAVVCAAGLILLQWVLPDVAAPAFMLLIASAILLAFWGRPRSRSSTAPVDDEKLLRQGWLALKTPLAILCCVGALLLFARKQEFFLSPPLTLFALLLVGIVLWLRPFSLPALTTTASVGSQRAIRPVLVLLGGLLLWLGGEISGNWLHWPALSAVSIHLQFLLLVVGIVLVVLGFGGQVRLPFIERHEMLLLAGIIGLAFLLRVIMLDTAVHHFVDEINFVDAIVRLWDAPNTPLLFPFGPVTAFTWIYPYLQMQVVSLFGHTLFGLRLTSVLFGTATIPALYFLARTIFGRKTALIAALLLATFPPHIHFSRIALNNIADPLFGTLALAFLARGLKQRQRGDYVLAGALLGLTQYFYEGGRLLFPGLLLLWLTLCWLFGPYKRERCFNGLLLVLTALLVAMPAYYTLAAAGSFAPRLDMMAILHTLPPVDIPQNPVFSWLVYTAIPDMGWFYGGNEAMILTSLAPLFLLGIAIMIWRVRTSAALLVLLWVALTSFGNMLLIETASLARYVVVFPAVVLVLAVGITYGVEGFWPKGFREKWRTAVLVCVVTLAAAGQTVYYFRDHLPNFNTQFILSAQPDEALLRTLNLPAQTRVHIILPQAIFEFNIKAFIRFWQPDVSIDAVFPEQVTPDYLKGQSRIRDVAHAFFVKASDQETPGKLRQYFTLLPPEYSPYDTEQVTHLVLYYGYPR